MHAILKCDWGVYVIALRVKVDGWEYNHAIAYDAAPGILVDNHGSARPIRIDSVDRTNKHDAKRAFRKLMGQMRVLRMDSYSLDTASVYQLNLW
eukprot:4635346-Pleurochrysis_carterae.AAC.1